MYILYLGLLLVIVGFSYSITSFNNFFSFIFKTRIFSENLNIYLMSIGLIVPLYVFVYGVYFYFYTDFNIVKINRFIFISNLLFFIFGVLIILFKELYVLNNVLILQIFEFIHISMAPCLIILSLLGIFGCFKYKY